MNQIWKLVSEKNSGNVYMYEDWIYTVCVVVTWYEKVPSGDSLDAFAILQICKSFRWNVEQI